MKKLLTSIIAILLFVTVYAQNNKEYQITFIKELLVETRGIVSESNILTTDDGTPFNMVLASLPLYYSFELITRKISTLVDSYSDVRITEPWKKIDNEGLIRCMVKVVDDYIVIYYSEPNNTIGFAF